MLDWLFRLKLTSGVQNECHEVAGDGTHGKHRGLRRVARCVNCDGWVALLQLPW